MPDFPPPDETRSEAAATGRLQSAFWDAYDNARIHPTGLDKTTMSNISATAFDAASAILQHENNQRRRPKNLDLGEKEKPCQLGPILNSLRSATR